MSGGYLFLVIQMKNISTEIRNNKRTYPVDKRSVYDPYFQVEYFIIINPFHFEYS